MKTRWFREPLPEVKDATLPGRLFVLEGPDGSGRTTQINQLVQWLEKRGFAVRTCGLGRSELVGEELEQATHGTVLTPLTRSLFYATDFYDQLLHTILPALRAGFIVLTDRYIYTLIARDLVRKADPEWARNLYGRALVPDVVFHLRVSAQRLVQRNFEKNSTLDYWEAGMDLCLSDNMFDSFVKYQRLMNARFLELSKEHKFEVVDANRRVGLIQADLRAKLAAHLGIAP